MVQQTPTTGRPSIEARRQHTKLEDVLPRDQPSWWKVRHLVLLNLCLVVPMMTNSSNGYDGSLLNGLQSLPQWRNYFDTPTGAILGALSNAYTLGNFVAFPVVAWFNDRWGRLGGLRVGCLISVIGAALQAAAQNYAMFFLARLIIGCGSVIALVGGPTLVSELAYPTHRTTCTALFGPSWYTGALIAAWVTYGTQDMQSTWAWRLPSLLQGAIPLLQVVLSFFIPESPRFLVSKGREDEARAMLNRYHAGNDPAYAALVEFEIDEIKVALSEAEQSKEVSYAAFISTKANRHRLFVVMFLAITSQLCGNALVSYYLNLILNSIGITSAQEQLEINGGLMAYNLVTAIAAGFLVGRLRRRPTFVFGLGFMLLAYIIWTVLSAINHQRNFEQASLGRGVLAMIFSYYISYNISMNALPNLYITEVLPYYLRAKGTTIFVSTQGLVLVYNGFVNPVAMDAISWRYYIVFCCLIAVQAVVIYFAFPETHGFTLEETAQAFGDGAFHTTSSLECGSAKNDADAAPIDDVSTAKH
ncbi:unnamed protein product [Cercospora beticola]|nr:unnamed protein product [Cercospora beticola]